MKTSISHISAFVILSVIILSGCTSEEALLVKQNKFYDADSKKVFNLEDQKELNRLALVLANEKTEITFLKDAEVVTLTDNLGDFQAISAQYQWQNRIVKMIVPIYEATSENSIKVSVKNGDGTYYTVSPESCTMKFSALHGECTYEIIERCKTLKSGGINTSSLVAFNNTLFRASKTMSLK